MLRLVAVEGSGFNVEVQGAGLGLGWGASFEAGHRYEALRFPFPWTPHVESLEHIPVEVAAQHHAYDFGFLPCELPSVLRMLRPHSGTDLGFQGEPGLTPID